MKSLKSLMLFLIASPLLLSAQQINYSDPIPMDADVRKGTLDNGLTYYIKQNEKPEDKVDLRLVINAGSILETEKQRGLAHFMEHMCFNGTERFPKNELVDYLQSIGVKFGQHLNAYTSFDETVYFLPIPSDDDEKLKKGFEILEDWAFNATLSPEEIDKERGVVLEEYRLGLGANKRMMANYIDKLMYGSRYAERLPIGEKEVLENFGHEDLIQFYEDWYRPELMSVIAVGDIDVDQIEKMIQMHFSKYKNPKNPKPRKTYGVPNHEETFVAVETDEEAPFSQVEVYYKDYKETEPNTTIGDYKTQLEISLFSTMINNRLDEIRNSNNPPFNYGFSYYGGTWSRDKKAYQSSAMVGEGKQLEALKVLVEENQRVKMHGFTDSELERAKTEMLTRIERQYKERDKTESSRYVQQLQNQFLRGSVMTNIEWDYEMTEKLFPEISVDDINGQIDDYIKKDNRVVILTGPEKEGLEKPSKEEVLEVINIESKDLAPYQDEAIAESLIRKTLSKGNITASEINETTDSKTLTLSNGAKVTYKQTDFKNDQILFEAISFGGSNLIDNATYKEVQWAMGGLTEAGFSGMDKNAISKFMSGKTASVTPYVSSASEGMRGSSTPKDLEYLMQMIQAYFTDLNYDEEAFESFKTKQNAFMSNLTSMPNFYFQEQFYTFLSKDNPRFNGILPDEEAWNQTDYKKAYEIYQERFENAGDFHFYFVGNINEDEFKSYLETYIASLPATETSEEAVDLGYRMLEGDHKKVVKKGKDPKSQVTILFYGETEYSPKEALAMNAVGEVLTIKLIEELREGKSGVYGAGASGRISKVPYGSYNFSISFPCGPENAENLTESALAELDKIIQNGPDAEDLNKFKESEKLEYKEKMKENKFWLDQFTQAYTYDTSLDRIMTYKDRIESLTAEDIQNVAKKYLSKDKVIGMLMPEED
ncbi:insulinase family protein [Psychroflexus sp. CAK1W]|uniref:M16 family metallopeptidase n=1 Tax=Psychroflexus curvus TaxID=2873595 RepID=UPI001CCBC8A2|nr:M16 family metallopeptidase [Psychroflexus curvus]MBZ9628496.1 insulinase family protein [Psychroflexus curvus]